MVLVGVRQHKMIYLAVRVKGGQIALYGLEIISAALVAAVDNHIGVVGELNINTVALSYVYKVNLKLAFAKRQISARGSAACSVGLVVAADSGHNAVPSVGKAEVQHAKAYRYNKDNCNKCNNKRFGVAFYGALCRRFCF